MIWNSMHLLQEARTIDNRINPLIKTSNQLKFEENADYISIIGGGPFGFYALENLLSLSKVRSGHRKLKIHWYNKNRYFGAGQKYNPTTPNYLLVHECIAELSAWKTGRNTLSSKGLSLMEWINENRTLEQEPDKSDHCSRELFGLYLMDCVLRTIAAIDERIELSLIQKEICDLEIQDNTAFLFNEERKLTFPYQSTLISIGHSNKNNLLKYIKDNEQPLDRFIQSVHPLENLDWIPANAEVAIKGSGINFMETILHLTEGRGGVFYKNDQEFQYIPTGLEPKLYPFSRTNLPTLPRNTYWSDHKYELLYLTDDWVEELKTKKGNIDFITDILPLYKKEIQHAFYSMLDHLKTVSHDEVLHFIEIQDERTRFSINALLDPVTYSNVAKDVNYNEFIADLTTFCLIAMKPGELNSTMGAATGAMREGFFQICKLYEFGGFTPYSQKHVDDYWLNYIFQISLGPSREISEKFFCLLKQGYVSFLFSESPEIEIQNEGFLLKTKKDQHFFSYLIDSTKPKENVKCENNRLFTNLYKKRIFTEFKNGEYYDGKIDIDINGKVKGNQSAYPLYLYGPATEGPVLYNSDLNRNRYDFGEKWAKQSLMLLDKLSLLDFT